MIYAEPTRRSTSPLRARRLRAAALALAMTATGIALGLQAPAPESSRGRSPTPVFDGGAGSQVDAPLASDDGAIPDETTVFEDRVSGVANLDPALLEELRRAAGDAGRDGVRFSVDSGWRSAAYQRSLLADAIRRYGSEQEAARWVASPERSAHVSGDAVDLGPQVGRRWLAERGAAYDLCQIYDNEPWHFELRPGAADGGCPAHYLDAAHDPRLQP